MLDWLRRSPRDLPGVAVAGRRLPVVIRRLPQARRMTLRLAPDGSEVRISMPRWGLEADALAFATSRADWLAGQLDRLPSAHGGGQGLAPGALLRFRGEMHRIDHVPKLPRRPVATDGTIRIGGPAEGLEGRIKRWLQAEARVQFAADLAHYTARAGVPMPQLALSGAKARWGSCSARGIVRLNWRLIMAPDAVRRSVVAHEVTHLLHFDHSPRFHAALGDLFEGDLAAANRWLKAEGRSLYAQFG